MNKAYLALAVLMAPISAAFQLADQRWESPITYYVHTSCPESVVEFLPSIVEFMTPVENTYGGITDIIELDDKTTVYCEDIQSLVYLPQGIEMDVAHSTLGTARRYWYKETQAFVDCDVYLNMDRLTEDSLETVMTHEWGHCLGLNHESFRRSIMFPYYLPPISSETLTIDDLAGINVLYDVCEDIVDEESNHFMHKVPVNDEIFYGVMPVNGTWPRDVHTIGRSNC
jgi:hypothetical protein